MTWTDVEAILNSPGAIALFALAILWTGAKGVWLFGHLHDKAIARERERAKDWKDIALGTLPIAEKTVDILERRRGE